MIQADLFQGNQIYTVVVSIILYSFPSMSLSIRSTVKQKEDKINSFLTCLCRVHFRRMAAEFYHSAGRFIALHSVSSTI